MPIYAYRCSACGHAKDVLQKMSDPLLTMCPACGADTFTKQVTAAGFQLKGSGWYVTDFRGGNTGASKTEGGGSDGEKGEGLKPAADKPAEGKTETKADAKAASTTETKSTAPAAAPPPSSSGS